MTAIVVAKRILADVASNKIDGRNAISIVMAVARYVRGDGDAATEVLECLAKGPDGMLGTADDLPPSTVKALRRLLDTALVAQLAQQLGTRRWSCC